MGCATAARVLALSTVLATALLASGSPPGVPEYSPPYSPLPAQNYDDTTCSDAAQQNSNYLVNLASSFGTTNSSVLDGVESFFDFSQLGPFIANASGVADFGALSSVQSNINDLVSSDFQASGDTWAILFKAINFSSVGQILSTVHTPLDSDQLNTLGNDLATAVDPVGLGYFLGNVTTTFHLAEFGSYINQLLRTINFTQIGVLAEGLPKLITNLPAAATALGGVIEGANFTDTGSATNGYIATLGTLISGCGNQINDSSTYTLPQSNSPAFNA